VRKLLIFIALFAICDAVVATSSPDPSQDVEKPVRVNFSHQKFCLAKLPCQFQLKISLIYSTLIAQLNLYS